MRASPERIRSAREAAGLTRTQLGAAVGRTEQTIWAWERGTRAPDAPTLIRVASACGVPVADVAADDVAEVAS